MSFPLEFTVVLVVTVWGEWQTLASERRGDGRSRLVASSKQSPGDGGMLSSDISDNDNLSGRRAHLFAV